jgi:hypothetical protein
VNALAKQDVGDYLNAHFAAAYQKVGTFRLVGQNKQGGNVASYFCTPDGRVLHAIAGPIEGAVLLREARWVVESWKMAELEKQNSTPVRLKTFFGKAHYERLRQEYGVELRRLPIPTYTPSAQALAWTLDRPAVRDRGLSNQARVHLLLALYPALPIEQVYAAVFEKILNERVTTQPVEQNG